MIFWYLLAREPGWATLAFEKTMFFAEQTNDYFVGGEGQAHRELLARVSAKDAELQNRTRKRGPFTARALKNDCWGTRN